MLLLLPVDTMRPTDIMWVVLCYNNEGEGGHEGHENYTEGDNDDKNVEGE